MVCLQSPGAAAGALFALLAVALLERAGLVDAASACPDQADYSSCASWDALPLCAPPPASTIASFTPAYAIAGVPTTVVFSGAGLVTPGLPHVKVVAAGAMCNDVLDASDAVPGVASGQLVAASPPSEIEAVFVFNFVATASSFNNKMCYAQDSSGTNYTVIAGFPFDIIVASDIPTAAPMAAPSIAPTVAPTAQPSNAPTARPTARPTASPSATPTSAPSVPACKCYDQAGALPSDAWMYGAMTPSGSFGWCDSDSSLMSAPSSAPMPALTAAPTPGLRRRRRLYQSAIKGTGWILSDAGGACEDINVCAGSRTCNAGRMNAVDTGTKVTILIILII